MLNRSTIRVALRTGLLGIALVGCADSAQTSESEAPVKNTTPSGAESSDGAADFELAELKGFTASPRVPGCDVSNECKKGAGEASESCRAAAKSCLEGLSAHTAKVIAAVSACREAAQDCVKESPRAECRSEFASCTKGAFEGATRESAEQPSK